MKNVSNIKAATATGTAKNTTINAYVDKRSERAFRDVTDEDRMIAQATIDGLMAAVNQDAVNDAAAKALNAATASARKTLRKAAIGANAAIVMNAIKTALNSLPSDVVGSVRGAGIVFHVDTGRVASVTDARAVRYRVRGTVAKIDGDDTFSTSVE